MILYHRPDLKLIPTKDGGFRAETMEEYNIRIEKERKYRYNQNISRIMERGFTRKQAEYLFELENDIRETGRELI